MAYALNLIIFAYHHEYGRAEEFKAKQYKACGEVDVPLAKKNFAMRLPIDVQEILDNLPPEIKVPFLRKLISDAVRKKFGNSK